MVTLIITNNPRVEKAFSDCAQERGKQEHVDFYPDAGSLDILILARNQIHLGARLIMHTMAGRIRPNETPYKSVYLEESRGDVDPESLSIIESDIRENVKYRSGAFPVKFNDALLPDLQYMDYTLLMTGIEACRRQTERRC